MALVLGIEVGTESEPVFLDDCEPCETVDVGPAIEVSDYGKFMTKEADKVPALVEESEMTR